METNALLVSSATLNMRVSYFVIGLVVLTATAILGARGERQAVKTFQIDLDLDPKERYAKLLPYFNDTVWGFYNTYFAKDKVLTDVLYGLSKKRGIEKDPEQQAEIQAYADLSRLPLQFVQSIQMLYEIQTLMVPIVNFSKTGDLIPEKQKVFRDYVPKEYEELLRIPWRGPSCTGIIAQGEDGTVYHARNLDFSPVPFMKNLVYNGIFMKSGKELFRSQMIAGYTMIITAAKLGSDGYAIERNTRYTDHWGGNKEMINNLESGRTLNGWTLRKILETEATYDNAVGAISKALYASTEYAIVSGVRKGTILSKNPEGVAYTQTLGQRNFNEPKEYIIITNFDFFFHDIREWFDPTAGGGFGKPTRRETAQKLLNESAGSLTQDKLFEVINAKNVLADTVFQAIINIERGIWNTSIPDAYHP